MSCVYYAMNAVYFGKISGIVECTAEVNFCNRRTSGYSACVRLRDAMRSTLTVFEASTHDAIRFSPLATETPIYFSKHFVKNP